MSKIKREWSAPQLLRTVLIATVCLVISLGLLLIAQLNGIPELIKSLLEIISTTILAAASVGLTFDYISRNEMIRQMTELKDNISQQIRSLRALDELGLVDAYPDVNAYAFNKLILESDIFVAVMNDGKSWVGRNAGDLRRRLLIPNFRTTFILQHPDSKMIDILAAKVQQEPSFIKQKILDTIRELNSFERNEGHNLTILGHHYFNVHSLFQTSEFIAHTPYLITPGRNTTPIFIFQKRGLSSQYQRWSDDIDQLIKLSIPLENPNDKLTST